MKYFNSDGIRQPIDKFTPEFIATIVKGLVDYAGDNVKVLIGGDAHESTEWILTDLETALETFGIEYGNVGILSTSAINYCFPAMGFDIAIDVTTPHDSHTDHCIKIFELNTAGASIKLNKDGREAIESAITSGINYTPVSPSLRENLHDEATKIYQDHLNQTHHQ